MNSLMCNQNWLLCESLPTFMTCRGFLSSMNFLVCKEIWFFGESLPTFIVYVGSLLCMTLLMLMELWLESERIPTTMAFREFLIWPFWCIINFDLWPKAFPCSVHPQGISPVRKFQGTLRREFWVKIFPQWLPSEGFSTRMDSLMCNQDLFVSEGLLALKTNITSLSSMSILVCKEIWSFGEEFPTLCAYIGFSSCVSFPMFMELWSGSERFHTVTTVIRFLPTMSSLMCNQVCL